MGDEYFLKIALKEAKEAYRMGEVPVGAVITLNNKIIAKSHNMVETLKDPTSHAEILAITQAANFLKNWRLEGTTLYVTLEPCLMCTGAILNSRISEVVYLCDDPEKGTLSKVSTILRYLKGYKIPIVRKGELNDEAKLLLEGFFKSKRY